MRRFTPLFADAACFARHCPGGRWFVEETYVKIAGIALLHWFRRLRTRREVRDIHEAFHSLALRRQLLPRTHQMRL